MAYADISTAVPLEPNIDGPLEVLGARPDLKAAELRLEQAFKTTQIQNRNWYPSISLKAALSSSASDIKDTFSFPVLGGSVSINLPVLQWNTVKNNIKISEADYESARLGFESSINTALNELAYYYYAYDITKSTYENALKKHATDTQLLDTYMARYKTGKIEMSDLLTAMNTENNSSRDVLNNSYQVIKYENMIYKAMAGRYY